MLSLSATTTAPTISRTCLFVCAMSDCVRRSTSDHPDGAAAAERAVSNVICSAAASATRCAMFDDAGMCSMIAAVHTPAPSPAPPSACTACPAATTTHSPSLHVAAVAAAAAATDSGTRPGAPNRGAKSVGTSALASDAAAASVSSLPRPVPTSASSASAAIASSLEG